MHAKRTRFAKDIVAEVYEPKKLSNKVVILAPGMPAEVGKKKLGTFLAKNGYWFIEPRYRGTWESAGYFLDHEPTEDLKDIVSGLSAPFQSFWDETTLRIANPEIYILGSSFGGPAAIALASDDRVKKVVSVSGVVDWQVRSSSESLEWIYEYLTPNAYGEAYRYKQIDDWRKLETGTFYNPVNYETVVASKILMIHSDDDTVVPYVTAQSFSQRHSIPLITLKGEGHAGSGSLMKRKVWKQVKKHFEI